MRLKLLLVPIALLGATLISCNVSPPSPPPPPPPPPATTETIKGNVFQSIGSGANPLTGAKVTVIAGTETKTATTGPKGEFAIELAAAPTTFSILAEPPAGSGLGSIIYDQLPFEAYTSEFGASREFNFYLPGGPATSLPGFTARFGCLGGSLTDGGNPVVSTALSGGPNRLSPATCDGTVPPNIFNASPDRLRLGENGLVMYGGFRAVRTKADGSYLIPVLTTNNGWAFSGSLWAGNYTGQDNPDPNLANEFYWDKFAYVPQAEVFLNGSTQVNNLALEPFDPATNSAKVATLKVSHDTSALTGFDFTDPSKALAFSEPIFNDAITSGNIQLGEYYLSTGAPGNMRVPKLQNAKQGQNIQVDSSALSASGAGSFVTFWRDGTNLGEEVKADFLAIPSPQAPANNATAVNRKPALSWKAVPKARLYEVDIFEDANPATTAFEARLVGFALTDKTSLTLPNTLQASRKHRWQVFAFDSTTLADAVGVAPEAIQISHWRDLNRPKLAGFQNELNQYREQLAKDHMAALGYLPEALEYGGINLKQTGTRNSGSEQFFFTTGP